MPNPHFTVTTTLKLANATMKKKNESDEKSYKPSSCLWRQSGAYQSAAEAVRRIPVAVVGMIRQKGMF